MARLYSLSVQICLEIFCLGPGGGGNYLLLEVKIILSGCFVLASRPLRVCLSATFGVRKVFLPHLRAAVPCVPCPEPCMGTRGDPLPGGPLPAPRSIAPGPQRGTAPACTSAAARTGNLRGLCCGSALFSHWLGCWYRLPTLRQSMCCSCRVAGECSPPGVTGEARQLSLLLTEMLEAKQGYWTKQNEYNVPALQYRKTNEMTCLSVGATAK